jgi:hypothetical protein
VRTEITDTGTEADVWEGRRRRSATARGSERSTPPRTIEARRILAKGHDPAKVASASTRRIGPSLPTAARAAISGATATVRSGSFSPVSLSPCIGTNPADREECIGSPINWRGTIAAAGRIRQADRRDRGATRPGPHPLRRRRRVHAKDQIPMNSRADLTWPPLRIRRRPSVVARFHGSGSAFARRPFVTVPVAWRSPSWSTQPASSVRSCALIGLQQRE